MADPTPTPAPTSATMDWTALGTGLAGLLGLLGLSQGSSTAGGYVGRVPNYTATRTMNPIPQTVQVPAREYLPPVPTAGFAGQTAAPAYTAPRRPGSGGITYFTPMQYGQATTPIAPAPTGTPTTTTDFVPGYWNRESRFGAAGGGLASLRGFSDGGQLLRGPGDGVSDSIPATIGQQKKPAALADGEFVIPARIVSEIGNGSTEAGARKLYAMMDRIAKARRKTTDIAANTRTDRYLPK